ncbi:MAG: enoyl-CoA hydratase-related protein [Pseudomonadota bacterium]
MTPGIDISTSDHITRLTINRPEKKNAITQAMYGAMADALEAYGEDDAIRAFVFTGAGDMFTSGNDLQDFATGSSEHDVPPVFRFLTAIAHCPKPLIAAVNGPAIGVGLTMLLHCDLVYAAKAATFGAPFVKLGLVPEAASSLLLPEVVGMAIANDILLAGRTLTASEAHDYGLVARVFAEADLEREVHAIAAQVAASAPTAMKHSKSLIRHRQKLVADHMKVEAKLFNQQLQSTDFAESVAAMMQKRAPVYS